MSLSEALLKRGFTYIPNLKCYVKENIAITCHSNHYNINGPFYNDPGVRIGLEDTDKVINLIVIMENPMRTILNATTKISLELPYYLESLEPILFEYDIKRKSISMKPLTINYYHPNNSTILYLNYDILEDEIIINRKLIVNEKLTPDIFREFLIKNIFMDGGDEISAKYSYLFNDDPKDNINTFKEIKKILMVSDFKKDKVDIHLKNLPDRFRHMLEKNKDKFNIIPE